MHEEAVESLGGTATAFANWVFEKTVPFHQGFDPFTRIELEQKLALGRFMHAECEQLWPWLRETKAGPFLTSKWELIHADPHSDERSNTFSATRLSYQGKPLRCRPDVVFRDRESNRILIVERKTTKRKEGSIPSEAWPNIRAQLWCYSWIDDWADAPEVILVSQFIRRRAEFQNFGRRVVQNRSYPWIYTYSSRPSFLRSDPAFQGECKKLFSEYGGQIV